MQSYFLCQFGFILFRIQEKIASSISFFRSAEIISAEMTL